MTQLSIELDEQTGIYLETKARAEGLKPQEWIERLVRRHVHPEWPESVQALVGTWSDFPTARGKYRDLVSSPEDFMARKQAEKELEL